MIWSCRERGKPIALAEITQRGNRVEFKFSCEEDALKFVAWFRSQLHDDGMRALRDSLKGKKL